MPQTFQLPSFLGMRQWIGLQVCLLASISLLAGCSKNDQSTGETKLMPESDSAYHVREGEDIQAALDAAAQDSKVKTVKVHEGTYFPKESGQAFIHLNKTHDGIRLEAVGKVTLTAANSKIGIVTSRSFPAIVNHVVYFGNGVSSNTVIDGFEITGANGHMVQEGVEAIEPELPESLKPTLFFYSDGGAVKIYGDSCPQLLNLRIHKNEVRVCGGGVSVDQHGLCDEPVLIKNCVFTENRCPATGSAIDVLQGSKAKIENCLFVGNIGNYGMDEIAETFGLSYNSEHGCGAMSVFPESTVSVTRCTFTANWSGIDDKGINSQYSKCILWKNDKTDGSRIGDPFEMDLHKSATVTDCFIFGTVPDLQKTIDRSKNNFDEIDPLFDENFVPQSKIHQEVGYRPKS